MFTLAIQCTDRDGKVGCFLYDENDRGNDITPTFAGLSELFDHIKGKYIPFDRTINSKYVRVE